MQSPPGAWLPFILAGGICIAIGAPPAGAQSFVEDFEGDLSQWVGDNGDAHHAEIVADPLRFGNNVVHFFALEGGGDIFGPEIDVSRGQSVSLSFEYLGLPAEGSRPDDFGGFIGYALDLAPSVDCSQSSDPNDWDNVWIGGTRASYCNLLVHLIDDGAWHYYELEMTPVFSPMRLILEDHVGPVAGDAYFDNLSVTLLCPADLDGNGPVNVNDLTVLLANFGDPGPDSPGDADGDGDTDRDDLELLLLSFGASCP